MSDVSKTSEELRKALNVAREHFSAIAASGEIKVWEVTGEKRGIDHQAKVWAERGARLASEALAAARVPVQGEPGEHFHAWSEVPCKPGHCRMGEPNEHCCKHPKCPGDSLCCCQGEPSGGHAQQKCPHCEGGLGTHTMPSLDGAPCMICASCHQVSLAVDWLEGEPNDEPCLGCGSAAEDGHDDCTIKVRTIRVSVPDAAADAREHLHAKCDCVPDLGPAHCHLCSGGGAPVPWPECEAVTSAVPDAAEEGGTPYSCSDLGHYDCDGSHESHKTRDALDGAPEPEVKP